MNAEDAPAAGIKGDADTIRITVGPHTFGRRGGRLCLDFVNTVDNWHAPREEATGRPESDYLAGYGDLLAWAGQVGAVADGALPALRVAAERRADEAEEVFRRAVRLRTAFHDVVVAAAEGRPTPEAELAALNREIERLLVASRLEPDGEAFVLARPGERGDATANPPLDLPLWPVLRSAIALLTSAEDLARVHACPDEKCGWVFYDATGRRRWCSMAACGTRDKVRRFRARQRASA